MVQTGYDGVRKLYQEGKIEEANVCFREFAHTLGSVDSATQNFRKKCSDVGFGAVFSEGIPRNTVLKILRSPETMGILNSGEW